MKSSRYSRKRAALILVLVVVLVGGCLLAADWAQMRTVIAGADWRPVPYALLFTVVSYVCASYSFAWMGKMLGIRGGLRDLTEIAFVSLVLNHTLTTGGAAGYSARYMLMRQRGAEPKDILSLTVLHFYLSSLIMLGMLPIGLIHLQRVAPVGRSGASIFIALSILLLIALFLGTGLVFSEGIRGSVLKVLSGAVRRLAHRDIEPRLQSFSLSMTRGVVILRARPVRMLLVMALIVGDWIASVLALWFCLDAMGPPVGTGDLVTSFVLGTMAGVVSLIPGGIGVQEGSMAGVFALLGRSFEQAALASVLFRGVFYIVPYFASLVFYWRLLERGAGKRIPSFGEV